MQIINEPSDATLLDPDEMQGLKFKHVTTREQLDHLEQANIQMGLRWLSHYKKTDLLQVNFVRTLHKKLFSTVWKWAGNFRITEKNIGMSPNQIAIQLRLLLDDAHYWIEHKTYSPLELAARFHHRLVFIHLFPNGNGRHARIMTDAILTKLLKEKPIDWSGGFDLQRMNERRQTYIQALREADKGNYASLMQFVGSA